MHDREGKEKRDLWEFVGRHRRSRGFEEALEVGAASPARAHRFPAVLHYCSMNCRCPQPSNILKIQSFSLKKQEEGGRERRKRGKEEEIRAGALFLDQWRREATGRARKVPNHSMLAFITRPRTTIANQHSVNVRPVIEKRQQQGTRRDDTRRYVKLQKNSTFSSSSAPSDSPLRVLLTKLHLLFLLWRKKQKYNKKSGRFQRKKKEDYLCRHSLRWKNNETELFNESASLPFSLSSYVSFLVLYCHLFPRLSIIAGHEPFPSWEVWMRLPIKSKSKETERSVAMVDRLNWEKRSRESQKSSFIGLLNKETGGGGGDAMEVSAIQRQ